LIRKAGSPVFVASQRTIARAAARLHTHGLGPESSARCYPKPARSVALRVFYIQTEESLRFSKNQDAPLKWWKALRVADKTKARNFFIEIPGDKCVRSLSSIARQTMRCVQGQFEGGFLLVGAACLWLLHCRLKSLFEQLPLAVF
jgi:hypothetical protein